MTEKRYELFVYSIWDNVEDRELTWEELVDLLNENEQLKEKNENYKMALEQCGVNVKILDGDVE